MVGTTAEELDLDAQPDISAVGIERALQLYERKKLIRVFEERANRLDARRKARETSD